MKNVDKVIKTIYLASSDVRPEMMASLVENILYAWSEPLSFEEICSTIGDEFTIEPSPNEVRESINALIDQKFVVETSRGFALTAVAKAGVDQKVKQNLQAEQARYTNFERVLQEIQAATLTQTQRDDLWRVYNDYVNECFLQYQRDAVKMFMSYSMADENGTDLIKQYVGTLNDPVCRSIFPTLVVTYPNYLSEADLNHISLIAERAERFYSLGLPEEDYRAATDFKVSNWVLIADTNVLYSILKLRDHAEGEACLELAQLAKTGLVGFRIAYLPFTLTELKTKQYDLSGRVISTSLTANQINVLRRSGKLDPFMQPYYDQLATTGHAVPPAERIEKAQYILKNEKIEIYNPKQITNLQENGQHMSQAYSAFYDFERLRNEARSIKNLGERNKGELQVEHDILLREVILALRDGKTSLAEVKQIGLTLDDALLRFDRYMIDRQRLHTSTAPTFFLPSLLLRRLRGFIPIKTTDYRKAFFRAVSTKTFDPENKPLSTLVQRSVAYFNALGIDNPQIMMQMLSDEIFLIGLEEADKQGQGEKFTRSELDKRFGEMEKNIEALGLKVDSVVADKDQQAAKFEEREYQLRQETVRVNSEAELKIKERDEIARQNEQRFREEKESIVQAHSREREADRKAGLAAQLELLVDQLSDYKQKDAMLRQRVKIHLSLLAVTLLMLYFGIAFHYYSSVSKDDIEKLLVYGVPVAAIGSFVIRLLFGKEYTTEFMHENITFCYRWVQNKITGFDPVRYDQIQQQVEQLRTELRTEVPVKPKMVSPQF